MRNSDCKSGYECGDGLCVVKPVSGDAAVGSAGEGGTQPADASVDEHS